MSLNVMWSESDYGWCRHRHKLHQSPLLKVLLRGETFIRSRNNLITNCYLCYCHNSRCLFTQFNRPLPFACIQSTYLKQHRFNCPLYHSLIKFNAFLEGEFIWFFSPVHPVQPASGKLLIQLHNNWKKHNLWMLHHKLCWKKSSWTCDRFPYVN